MPSSVEFKVNKHKEQKSEQEDSELGHANVVGVSFVIKDVHVDWQFSAHDFEGVNKKWHPLPDLTMTRLVLEQRLGQPLTLELGVVTETCVQPDLTHVLKVRGALALPFNPFVVFVCRRTRATSSRSWSMCFATICAQAGGSEGGRRTPSPLRSSKSDCTATSLLRTVSESIRPGAD